MRLPQIYDESDWISPFIEASARTELIQSLWIDKQFSVLIRSFLDKWKNKIGGKLNVMAFQELHQRITDEIREEIMGKFDLHLKQQFIIAPCLSMLLQRITCDPRLDPIIEELEINRRIFQIMMDDSEEYE